MELFRIFPQKFLGNPKESPNFAPAFGKEDSPHRDIPHRTLQ